MSASSRAASFGMPNRSAGGILARSGPRAATRPSRGRISRPFARPRLCSFHRSSSSAPPDGPPPLLLPPVLLLPCSSKLVPDSRTVGPARLRLQPLPVGHPKSPRMSTEQGVATGTLEFEVECRMSTGTEATNLLKRNSDDVGWEYGVLVDASNKDKVKCKLCDKEMRGGIHRLKEHLAHEGKNQHQLNKELWKERTNDVHKYIARWAYTHGIAFNACDNDEFKKRSIMNLCTNFADGTSFISSKEMSHISHTGEVIFDLVDKAIEEIGPDNVVQVVTDNASNNMGAKRLLEEKRPHIFWTSCAAHTINLMLQGIGSMTQFKKVVDQAKAFTIFVYGHTRTLECLRYFIEGKEVVRPGVTRFASNFLTLSSMQEKKDQLRKMVVHSRWDSLKDVKSKKGKEATATILSPSFWKDVKLTLTVFEPLVKVLRLVNGDVRTSMGFLYGELLKAKRQIKEAFGNVEARFKDVIAVIDKKMNGRLDSPLHLIAYLLNPDYSYSDPSIFDQPKISEGFIACVEKFYYHDEDMQHQAANIELKKFQNREGPFSKKLARTFENFDYNPASWWRLYGYETPALQKMATRILSLTSSTSGCERNWTGFEGIHTKKRNRLTTTRLNKLVYIQFNSKLLSKRQKIKSNKIIDVLLSSDTTEAQDFLQEGGDDCALVDFRDGEEDEMEGIGIPWSVIGEAVGADEQLQLRRSARVRELYEGEDFESEEEEYDDEDVYYSEEEI
ncbi:unnamed protein product [Miscanthus lutarioriparius]|uniref:BED-type domain-containing protein n=1 Tax=Miscanthus lutarioriparius TaxID=422564 RepID=A0A811PUV8_9POAL|nr:unnamed protein product [Miscanthus lutarioriparius]